MTSQPPLRQVPLREPRFARRSRGITLLELIIAMVIVSILASIAIPSYSNYVRQSRRTDAKTALMDMASLEERYFSVNNAYSTATTDLGYGGAFPVTVGGGYFVVQAPAVTLAVAPTAALPAGTPASFTLEADAIGDQANDTCQKFFLTSAGVQTAQAPADPNGNYDCWH